MRGPAARRGVLEPALIALALALLVGLVFERVRGHAFLLLDDAEYVTANGWVLGGMSAAGARWAFAGFHFANWSPLTWLSHMLDVELFGVAPGPHHLVNVGLHAANAALFFLALWRMSGALWAPALAAAFFALHPLRVESVAWVSGRKDVLSGLFFMLTLLAYAGHAARPTAARYAAALAAYACGLLAKPMLVTLPFVLVLLDVWPLRRIARGADGRLPRARLAALAREKLPFLALAAASGLLTLLAQRSGGSLSGIAGVPLGLRIANAFVAYGSYLWKTIWPSGLAYFHPHPADQSELPAGFWLACAASALALALGSFAALRLRRRPHLAVGWFWFLGMLVPVIGLVQVGGQAWADRYTYLPSLGLALALAWGLADLVRARPRLGLPVKAAAAGALLLLGWAAREQTATWRDDRTLFAHALAVTSRNHVAHTHLGTALLAAGDVAAAERHLREALALRPDFALALNALGTLEGARGDLASADERFALAMRVAPGNPVAAYNRGLVRLAQGRPTEAEALFREALELQPDLARAHFGLGRAHEARGDVAAATRAYRTALALDPATPGARAALAGLARFDSRAPPPARTSSEP
jgi:Flp pilus assembly protein TadD